MKLLVKDIGTLVTVCQGRTFLAGPDMANISVRTGCLALAVDDQGHIAMLGSQEEVDLKQYLPLVLSSVAGGRKVCRVFLPACCLCRRMCGAARLCRRSHSPGLGGGPSPRVRHEAGRRQLHGGPRCGRWNTLHGGEDEGGGGGGAAGAPLATSDEDAEGRDHHGGMQGR